MILIDWYTITMDALSNLWQGFIEFLPKLIGAFVIFIIGWLIAVGIGKLVAEILRKRNFNKVFEKGNLKSALDKANFKVDASGFVGAIFKWVLVIVFLLAAVEVLGLTQFASFLNGVLDYLPNIIVAVLILVVAVIISDILEKIVRASVESAKVGYGDLAGSITRWSIWVFAIFAILDQLGIAPMLIQTLLTGLVAFITIAGGIAFGLGGKDAAADFIGKVRGKFRA